MHGKKMHIACPNCHAIYDVPESKLESALSLRCHACRYSWPLDIAVKPRPRLPAPKDQRTDPVAPVVPPSDPLSPSSPGMAAEPQSAIKSVALPPDKKVSPLATEQASPTILPDQSESKTAPVLLKEADQPVLASEPPSSAPLSAPPQETDDKKVDAVTLNRSVSSDPPVQPSSSAFQPDTKWPAFDPQAFTPAAMYAESSLIAEDTSEDVDHPVHTDAEPEVAAEHLGLQMRHRVHILFWVGLPILIILALIIVCRSEIMQIIPASSSWFGRLGLS